MDRKYKLGHIILRKEFFGGIICNLNTCNYEQINKDAFLILRKLVKSLTIDELLSSLKSDGLNISKEKLQSFIAEFVLDKIIVDSDSISQDALIYFDDTDFSKMRKDCLNNPSSISIYITQKCPKACKHCVTSASPDRLEENELNKDQWIGILKKLREGGATSIVFTGGECLIKKDIFDILDEADKLNFSIGILSDYDQIDDDVVSRIKNIKHLEDFQVSLDGANERTHDWIRGKGSFEKAIRRMNFLKNAGIKYTTSTVAHKKNLSEMDDIIILAKELGTTYHYISPLSPYGRGKIMNRYILSDLELRMLGQRYLSYINDGLIKSRNPYWKKNIDKVADDNFDPFANCLSAVSNGFFNFSINWKGDCYLDSKLGSEGILKVGNNIESNLTDLWHNPILDGIRKSYEKDKYIYVDQKDIKNYYQ